jgi:hypothetical protein
MCRDPSVNKYLTTSHTNEKTCFFLKQQTRQNKIFNLKLSGKTPKKPEVEEERSWRRFGNALRTFLNKFGHFYFWNFRLIWFKGKRQLVMSNNEISQGYLFLG